MNHLLDEKEVAAILNCTTSALRRWRREGRGPRWIHIERLVRYRESDLVEFLERDVDHARVERRDV